MSDTPADRLLSLGLTLPPPNAAGANYVPFVRTGNLVYLSGQLSRNRDEAFIGKLGREFGVDEGQQAARLCGLNLIAQLYAALGRNLSRVRRCVRVGSYVNSMPDFKEHSQVINGVSDLFVAVFGDAGRHSRVSVGVAALPYDVAVEVEAIFEVV